MSSFIFSNNTTVYFGSNRMNNLPYVLKTIGKNVLIVFGGQSIKKNGILDCVLATMIGFDFQFFYFNGIEPNPKHSKINEGIKVCRQNNIDVILAIGGGSVIDSAKAISATVYANTDDVWDLVTKKIPVEKTIPVVAIPTTAATGSEMNGGAVISNKELQLKVGFGNQNLQPIAAFYNPEFTFSLPEFQTACGCADIISHIFDSAYFNKSSQMQMLKDIQTQVIRTVIKQSVVAMAEPKNKKARENLMWASSWALNGFMYENLKQSAVIHIIEHQLSAMYDITHGLGIAIIMPRWLRYIISEETAIQIAAFGEQCFDMKISGDKTADANVAVELLEKYLYDDLGLQRNLREFGVKEEDLKNIAAKTINGSCIDSIKPLKENDVYNILKLCL